MARPKKEDIQDGDLVLDDLPKSAPKKRTKKEKNEYYCSPKEFEEEIKLYYKTGEFTNRLGNMIKSIAYNMSFSPNFINYTYKDEMISDAIEKMSRAMVRKCFKVDSGFSPFSYFSMCSWNAFINRISKEKKIRSVQDEYAERTYAELIEEQGNYDIYIRNNKQNHDDCDE